MPQIPYLKAFCYNYLQEITAMRLLSESQLNTLDKEALIIIVSSLQDQIKVLHDQTESLHSQLDTANAQLSDTNRQIELLTEQIRIMNQR